LMRLRKALVAAEHRNPSLLEAGGERLGIAYNLCHIRLPIGQHIYSGSCQRGDAIHLVGGRHDREDSGRQWSGQPCLIPDDDTALWPAEGFARGTGQDRGALAEWILELPARDQAQLMSAVEEDVATPVGDDLVHLAQGEWEEGHREAKRDQLGANGR